MACLDRQIASALVVMLNAHTFSKSFTAARGWLPEFTLEELETLKVTVVPRTVDVTRAARHLIEEDFIVDIGIQKRLEGDPAKSPSIAEVDPWADLTEEILRFCFDPANAIVLTGIDRVIPISIARDYIPEHLSDKRTFSAVIAVTYRVHR